MKQRRAGARVVPYPKYQRLAAAAYRTVRDKPMIHGLLEVDVTRARTFVRAHQEQTGESLSFTAFLAACLAKAVDEHKDVQAFRQGSKRLILFDDVDIATRIEYEVAGQKYVVPYIIRAANRKTFRELHDEIRAAQAADVRHTLTRFELLPTALYSVFAAAVSVIGRWRPRWWKEILGTVGVTSVGMFGTGAGWGIPASAPTALMLTVGGIGKRQTVVDGRAAVQEYLCLTISVDHTIVDGAPAARFTQRLKELIESGCGLDASTVASAPVDAPATPQAEEAPYLPALP